MVCDIRVKHNVDSQREINMICSVQNISISIIADNI